MPNYALTGLPGHGKSYCAMGFLLKALENARVVVTNLAVNEDAIDKKGLLGKLVVVPEERLKDLEFLEEYPGAVFIIDEVRKWIPSGLQQKNLAANWDRLLSEHRHYEDWRGRCSDVFLVTQCVSQLPKCVRTLIDQTYIYEKLHKVGLNKAFRYHVYSGPEGITDAKKSALVNEGRGKYESKVFSLYRSHSKSVSSGLFEEQQSGSTNALMGAPIKAAMVMGLVGLGAFYWVFNYGLFAKGHDVVTETSEQFRPVAAATVERAAQPPLTDVAPPPGRSERQLDLSGLWVARGRCGGFYVDGELVYIEDCAGLLGGRTQWRRGSEGVASEKVAGFLR